MAGPKTYNPRDPAALARTAIVWVWVFVACTASSFLAVGIETVGLMRLPMEVPASQTHLIAGLGGADLAAAGVRMLDVVALLVSGFIVLKWTYRVNMNAKVLAPDKQVSPPWSVGWYFVPFALLLMPFRAMRETWQISSDPGAWKSQEIPSLLRWWWGCWLAASILGNVSWRLGAAATTAGTLFASDAIELVEDGFYIASGVLLVRIIRELTARQVDTLNSRAFS
jgi:hypothetical protein